MCTNTYIDMEHSQQVPLGAYIKTLHTEAQGLNSNEFGGITDFSKNWRGLDF